MTPYEIKQMEEDINYIKDTFDLGYISSQVHKVLDELNKDEENQILYTPVFSLPDDDTFLSFNVLKTLASCYYHEGDRILLYPINKLLPFISH